DDAADATSVAVQYKAGPLFVAAAHESFAADDTAAGTRFGLGYDAGVAKVGFVYETVSDASNVKGDDYTAFVVNAAIPVGGSNAVIAEYGVGELDSDAGDEEVTLMAIGLAHNFSKTSSAYVAYGNADVDVAGSVNDGDASILTAGMVVKF
ncbi:MAG: porin, partial [Thiohalomonadaceae bacterium]